MTQQENTPPGKDPRLWRLAQKRASFKSHLRVYLVVNAFLWIIWLFTSGMHVKSGMGYPWPLWPMFGWGIGLVFHYFGAYVRNEENTVEKEYQNLINNKNFQQ